MACKPCMEHHKKIFEERLKEREKRLIESGDTCECELFSVANLALERITTFLEMMANTTHIPSETMSFVGIALVDDAKHKISEIDDFITKKFGTIEIIQARYHNSEAIPGETRLAVKFTPAQL